MKLVIGCNYHTKWQSNKAMRFVLKEIIGDEAILYTRGTNKTFKTNINDLIFIDTNFNNQKARSINRENSLNKTKTHEIIY